MSDENLKLASYIWPDPRNNVIDPLGDVRKFIAAFESNYAPSTTDSLNAPTNSKPPFFLGTYSQALNEAKRSLRFLIIYLHEDSQNESEKFCQSSLMQSDVVRFLSNTEQVVLWGCNIDSPEGYRVSRTLRQRTFPFVGVVGLARVPSGDFGGSYSNSVITRMTVLGRIQGHVDAKRFLDQLELILRENASATESARLDKLQREDDARIRQEQDKQFAESLAQDQAKAEAAEADRLASQQLEVRQKLIAHAREARQLWWSKQMPPSSDELEPSVKLSIKMPDGSKLDQSFCVEHSAKIIYYYVLSQPNAPANFQIEANYPRRILSCKPDNESDLDDYLDERDAESRPKPEWGCEDRPGQPVSLKKLGLTRPELLYVVDLDA